VYAKFRCAPLHIKKALGISGPGRTDFNKRNNNNTKVAFFEPTFQVQKVQLSQRGNNCHKHFLTEAAIVNSGVALKT